MHSRGYNHQPEDLKSGTGDGTATYAIQKNGSPDGHVHYGDLTRGDQDRSTVCEPRLSQQSRPAVVCGMSVIRQRATSGIREKAGLHLGARDRQHQGALPINTTSLIAQHHLQSETIRREKGIPCSPNVIAWWCRRLFSPPRQDFGLKMAKRIIKGGSSPMIETAAYPPVCGSILVVGVRCPEDWRSARLGTEGDSVRRSGRRTFLPLSFVGGRVN